MYIEKEKQNKSTMKNFHGILDLTKSLQSDAKKADETLPKNLTKSLHQSQKLSAN